MTHQSGRTANTPIHQIKKLILNPWRVKRSDSFPHLFLRFISVTKMAFKLGRRCSPLSIIFVSPYHRHIAVELGLCRALSSRCFFCFLFFLLLLKCWFMQLYTIHHSDNCSLKQSAWHLDLRVPWGYHCKLNISWLVSRVRSVYRQMLPGLHACTLWQTANLS